MSAPKRAPGQVWAVKDGKPGVFLIVGPGKTSYGDAWSCLTLEPQPGHQERQCFVADDVWFMLFAELLA